jgi:DNA-nicking Smr family endonuclease
LNVIKNGKTAEIDLHGLTVEDAKYRLEHFLTYASPDMTEVRVIHGCNRGQALRDMVRLRLKHPRISAKLVTLNPGETRLLLKPPAKGRK